MKVVRNTAWLALTFSIYLLCAPVGLAEDGAVIYASRFHAGLDPNLILQAPNPDSVRIAPTQQRGAVRITVSRSDDYSHAGDGTPGAGISFASVAKFTRGKDYIIRWSTLLPKDFEFDTHQVDGLSQIHEGDGQGAAPFTLGLDGGSYKVRVKNVSDGVEIGDASADRGNWVTWSLHYIPGDTGPGAIIELYKNAKLVFQSEGSNVNANDDGSYFRIGIFKPWWQSSPSTVSNRSIYFGDVGLIQR